jgi:hypothetical protein
LRKICDNKKTVFGGFMKARSIVLILLFIVFYEPTTLKALSYTRYEICSWSSPTTIAGYAIIQDTPVIKTLDMGVNTGIEYQFIVTDFSILFNSGLVQSGSGYISLLDIYNRLTSEGTYTRMSTEDYWDLDGYEPGVSGMGVVNYNIPGISHNLLSNPINSLPTSFGLSYYFYDDYYYGKDQNGQYRTSNGITLINPSPVPEPSSLLLLCLGFAGIGFMKRRMGY